MVQVSFERPLGVSAKHLSEEVSTTVSQKVTTGSGLDLDLGVDVAQVVHDAVDVELPADEARGGGEGARRARDRSGWGAAPTRGEEGGLAFPSKAARLGGLLQGGGQRGGGLVELAEPLEHLGQLGWVEVTRSS